MSVDEGKSYSKTIKKIAVRHQKGMDKFVKQLFEGVAAVTKSFYPNK